jgi:hypothetical protein
MRKLSIVLGALALALLYFVFVTPGSAQTVTGDTTVIGVGATTVMTKEARVADDPQVHAAFVAIKQANDRYDHMAWSVTSHTLNAPNLYGYEPGYGPILESMQEIQWRSALHHGEWFAMHPLNNAEVLGYIAYLSERCRLTHWQQDKLGFYESHYIADLAPLYTAYRDACNSALAKLNNTQVVTVTVDRATISTIPPDIETTIPAESR